MFWVKELQQVGTQQCGETQWEENILNSMNTSQTLGVPVPQACEPHTRLSVLPSLQVGRVAGGS